MKCHCLGAVIALCASSVVSIAHADSVSGQGTWETTLQGRDLDGNLATAEAYYDSALGITWLTDGNAAQTFGDDADGQMGWNDANAWAANLNPYGSGITGWRLPTTTDTDGPDAGSVGNDGCNFAYSGTDCGYNVNTATGEMAYMFYATLGNKAWYDTSGTVGQSGWGLTNTGPFSNVQPVGYWSATEYAPNTGNAWDFSFSVGIQYDHIKANSIYAWAVHSGDIGAATVPVPAAAWLLASGLLGLLGTSRKRR